jgi:hypothetical protein
VLAASKPQIKKGDFMPIYNRFMAVQYALKWAFNRNPAFPDYSAQGGGGDCTNFVSQALLAGGWTMFKGILRDPREWWSDLANQYEAAILLPILVGTRIAHFSSRSWSATEHFRSYLKISSRAQPCSKHELAWGDLMFDIRSDGQAGHLMIVTDLTEQRSSDRHDLQDARIIKIFYSGHSNDRRNYPLDAAESQKKFEYWKVKDYFPD